MVRLPKVAANRKAAGHALHSGSATTSGKSYPLGGTTHAVHTTTPSGRASATIASSRHTVGVHHGGARAGPAAGAVVRTACATAVFAVAVRRQSRQQPGSDFHRPGH